MHPKSSDLPDPDLRNQVRINYLIKKDVVQGVALTLTPQKLGSVRSELLGGRLEGYLPNNFFIKDFN